MVDKQDFQQWTSSQVTQLFKAILDKRKSQIFNTWADEGYPTEYDNAKAIGMLYVITQIMELDYEGFVEALND